MKVKIIDLLVKLANGEEVPKEIRWSGVTFRYVEKENYNDYVNENNCSLFRHDSGMYKVTNMLDSEVEIIEESKEIEKFVNINITDTTMLGLVKSLNVLHKDYANKINELIDVVNELKKEEK